MNVNTQNLSLPFIMMPDLNLKILIDTGSTRSFITPEIANKYFAKKIQPDSGIIRTAHGTSNITHRTMVPCGKLFQNPHLNLPFSLFRFHNKFHMLLGLDNLQLIKAKVDFLENTLITPRLSIPLLYSFPLANKSSKSDESFLIEARSIQQIRINVSNVNNGEAIIPCTKINGLEIPQCLVNIENSCAFVHITNPTENPIKISMHTPIMAEPIIDNLFVETEESTNSKINRPKPQLDLGKLRLEHLNEEEKREVVKLVKEYADIFQSDDQPLTFTNEVKHHIRTSDEIPIYVKPYRYPSIYKNEVSSQLNKMLEQNIIRPSNSPYNAPLWVVPKKMDASGQKKFRLIIDFRKLNEKTISDRFPLPNITDLLDKLGRCQLFSILDLTNAFHQVELDETSIPKTAFSTDDGHYEFLRMPFGLKNAPPTFQRLMNNVLRGLQNEICLIYVDDILVYSSSLEEHITRLREVFKRLRKSNLKLQLDKIEFLRKEMGFLGHVITSEGVKPNPAKIQAITEFPIPKTRKEIKQFLGLLGYYRKFINNFAKITKPLTACLKKNTSIKHNDPEYQECFNTCKQLLTNAPILQYPDFEKEFQVTTDASDVALGAVLSQINDRKADLPIAFASRTLNDSERKLSTIEKELLAILFALKTFRPYLYGRRFTLFTDHRPLQWLFSLKDCSSKLFRWRLKLSDYDFVIKYKPGSTNHVADALSRIELNNNDSSPPIPSTSHQNSVPNIFSDDETLRDLMTEVNNDPEICDVINELMDNFRRPANVNDNNSLAVNLESNASDPELDTVHSNAEGNTILTIPIKDGVVNHGLRQIILKEITGNPKTPKISKLFGNKNRISAEISKSNFKSDIIQLIKEYVQPNVEYSLHFLNDDKGEFYQKFASVMMEVFKESTIRMTKYTKFAQDITDIDQINDIISNYHLGKTNHRGINETYEKLKRTYFWPNQKKSIQEYINRCEVCMTTKYDRFPIKPKFNSTPTANKPFEIIHIDKLTLDGNKFLTLVDAFSKYAQAYYLTSNSSLEVVKNLLLYFSHHGIPKQIISDNGAEFDSSLVKEMLTLHKIDIHFICSQNPNSNGIVERFHSTLVEHVRLLNNRNEFSCDSMVIKVRYAIIGYNHSIHSVTRLTPFEVVYGHIGQDHLLDFDLEHRLMNDYASKHKDRLAILYSEIANRSNNTKEKIIERLNKDREEIPKLPSTIFVKNKQYMSKTKNRFNKEKLESVDPVLKTVNIVPRHHNTKKKVHLANIRRPKKLENTNDESNSDDSSDSEVPDVVILTQPNQSNFGPRK